MIVRSKSVNRGWLRKQAAAGKLWLKCSMHLTDDYAWDNASNFCKMDEFKQVYLYQPLESEEYSKLEEELNELFKASHPGMPDPEAVRVLRVQIERMQRDHADNQREIAAGRMVFYFQDFKYKSGYVSGDKLQGSWSLHSNLYYDYEIREAA